MQRYIVYTRSEPQSVSIKNGFSWPAFFFGPFWAFSKGLVGLGFGLLVLGILLAGLRRSLPPGSPTVLVFALQIAPLIVGIVMGFEGNRMLRRDLEMRGFQPEPECRGSEGNVALGSSPPSQPGTEGTIDYVECPRCNAMIPPGEPRCPRCGWE